MRALTICQPYAHLICLPESDPRHKRVENRKWSTSYRGPLLIHAGKSRDWLDLDEYGLNDESYRISMADMAFGAAVAFCDLVDCLALNIGPDGSVFSKPGADAKYPWAKTHQHVEGPYCWILANVRPLKHPCPMKGAQGLWSISEELASDILRLYAS